MRIPQGVQLTTPMEAIHHDETFYADPLTYKAFRFCTADQLDRDASADVGSTLKKSSVTLDDAFLSFGFGKHACPGRFFALHEMKIMLAHMILNYDIEFLSARPSQKQVMWLQLPSYSTQIRVRKRSST
jgi:cytochrome P450